ncbi:hypothetical protein EDB86DRAFT_1099524 [Lactarius hatsudake]|nr:hypothetical protein EDB86DRAFT_1099524 [Lactarius hatsudake]
MRASRSTHLALGRTLFPLVPMSPPVVHTAVSTKPRYSIGAPGPRLASSSRSTFPLISALHGVASLSPPFTLPHCHLWPLTTIWPCDSEPFPSNSRKKSDNPTDSESPCRYLATIPTLFLPSSPRPLAYHSSRSAPAQGPMMSMAGRGTTRWEHSPTLRGRASWCSCHTACGVRDEQPVVVAIAIAVMAMSHFRLCLLVLSSYL